MSVVGRSVYRIDDPDRAREIELSLDHDLFAEKSMPGKLGAQMFANNFVRTQVRGSDKFNPLLMANLVRRSARPINDEIARSRGGGDGFVQRQLKISFTLHRYSLSVFPLTARQILNPFACQSYFRAKNLFACSSSGLTPSARSHSFTSRA